MKWLTNHMRGIGSLMGKARVSRELDEELEAYLEASIAYKRQGGMTAAEARRAALREMGSRNAVQHQVWSSRWESSLENLLTDVRIGWRALARSPGFTLAALLSLTLGIGANAAIFSLLNAVMLRPLPVPAPQQLVLFGAGQWVGSTGGMPSKSWQLFSYPFYRAFAARTSSFAGVTAVSSIQMGSHTSVNGGSPEQVHIDLVAGSYFSVLGVPPALGRVIAESDDQAPGAGPVAVASYGWYERHFQGSPAGVGRSIRIQGRDYTIIGVAQPGFAGLAQAAPADLWIPLSMEKEISPGWNGLADHDFQSLYLLGRLKPGIAAAQAEEPTNLLFRQIIRSQYLGANPSQQDLADIAHARIDLTSMAAGLPGLRLRYSAPLEILMGFVVLVLVMACANIANMLFARGVARAREIAVRQALGATRRRIVRQLLTESLLLALIGAGLGLLLAWGANHLLLSLGQHGEDVVPVDVTPDHRVLAFTLITAVLTALLFGIAPALRAARAELTPALKEGRGSTSSGARSALSRGLIAGQIALSILLLAAAGLFLHSLRNLVRVDPGFDPQHVLVFSLDEYAANLPLDERLMLLQQQIERNVQAIPGVRSASFSMFTFNQGEWSNSLVMQGIPPTPENSEDVLYNVTGNEFLETLGIPLIAGRNFGAQDTARAPKVAIVNETLARRFFPSGSPLGRHFCLCDGNPAHGQAGPFDVEIVGVVRDAKYVGLNENAHMAAYFPYAQRLQYFSDLSVRSTTPAATLIPAVRHAIAEVNSQIAIARVTPLADQVRGSIATQELVGILSGLFAALAVVLSAIGVYGLISYSVVRRTGEIGIRLALGAEKRSLVWLVVRESMLLLAAGMAVGLPLALVLAGSMRRVLDSALYRVPALDPWTFAAAFVIIAAMTLLAAFLPGRRATKIEPSVALRCE